MVLGLVPKGNVAFSVVQGCHADALDSDKKGPNVGTLHIGNIEKKSHEKHDSIQHRISWTI